MPSKYQSTVDKISQIQIIQTSVHVSGNTLHDLRTDPRSCLYSSVVLDCAGIHHRIYISKAGVNTDTREKILIKLGMKLSFQRSECVRKAFRLLLRQISTASRLAIEQADVSEIPAKVQAYQTAAAAKARIKHTLETKTRIRDLLVSDLLYGNGIGEADHAELWRLAQIDFVQQV